MWDAWLADAPAVDAGPYLLRRAARGELTQVGRWWLDLPALAQPYGCTAALGSGPSCAPGSRAPRARSCCADLEVTPTVEERAALAEAMPDIAEGMGGDPRWAAGVPAWEVDGALTRPGRRCVFARHDGARLRCGLVGATDRRPLACRLFPLAVVELDDGRRLLTAIHRDTASWLGGAPARTFPCLGSGTSLIEAEAAIAASLLGRAWPRVRAAVRAWRDRG